MELCAVRRLKPSNEGFFGRCKNPGYRSHTSPPVHSKLEASEHVEQEVDIEALFVAASIRAQPVGVPKLPTLS